MDNCVFCKIATGEIPKEKSYEDDQVMAFLSIDPLAPEHTLVVPKAHYRWFYDMPDTGAATLFVIAKNLAKTLQEKTGAPFIEMRVEGKDVPHVHVHLIPRNL